MRLSSNVLVTTTPDLKGMEIINYLGVVSSHIVAGTGLFSDMFASFSDIIGGRSGSYQNQLNSIKKEAIDELSKQAIQMGANAVISLSLDMDEISGKSKSMFMVTATGTAVVVKSLKENDLNFDGAQIIEGAHIAKLMDNELFKNEFRNKSRHEVYSTDEFENILNSRNYELIPDILYLLEEKIIIAEAKDSAINCINQMPGEELKPYLYKCIENNSPISKYAIELIVDKSIVDYKIIKQLLQNENEAVRKNGAILLQYDKVKYLPDDLNLIDDILSSLRNIFQERATYQEKKKMLSNKTTNQWLCTNNHTNDLNAKYCTTCGLDKYGFHRSEGFFEGILNHLYLRREILSSFFKGN